MCQATWRQGTGANVVQTKDLGTDGPLHVRVTGQNIPSICARVTRRKMPNWLLS